MRKINQGEIEKSRLESKKVVSRIFQMTWKTNAWKSHFLSNILPNNLIN